MSFSSTAQIVNNTHMEDASSNDNRVPSFDFVQTIFGFAFGSGIIMCSGLPAVTILRTPHLHRTSYFYVMMLCFFDCSFGCGILVMTLSSPLLFYNYGGAPGLACSAMEIILFASMNAINCLLLSLAKDRYISVKYPLLYNTISPSSTVRKHSIIAISYGVLHATGVVLSRTFFHGFDLYNLYLVCDPIFWLLDPRYAVTTAVSFSLNIILDTGTVVYSIAVLRIAAKAKQTGPVPATPLHIQKEVHRRRNLRIFLFILKLACLFLGCTLPFRFCIMAHAVGAPLTRSLIDLLGFIRTLYHILDTWVFCLNAELKEAMKAMLCREKTGGGQESRIQEGDRTVGRNHVPTLENAAESGARQVPNNFQESQSISQGEKPNAGRPSQVFSIA